MATAAMLRLPHRIVLAAIFALFGAAAPSKPHIILMLVDDLGWNNVGFRNPEIKTPEIDRLHSTGVELARMYTFKYCSPSRSSLMSGRLPLHVTQNNNNNIVTNPGGADLRMTLLPSRLKSAGYRTAMTGKWHVGARSVENLPVARGFDSHFGFLKGGEDHITQQSSDVQGINFVDLWRDNSPAYNENGTFSTFIYAREAVRVVQEHAAVADQVPLFLYLSWHAAHTPLEAPSRFLSPVQHDTKAMTRSKMNGLVAALDEGIRNVTRALEAAGMWRDTLLVFQADNGGWIQANFGGNNWPLRGGKVSDFEGGVRATAFVNGGFLDRFSAQLRGSTNTALMHIADWYATLSRLAGLPHTSSGGPADDAAVAAGAIPAVDSVDIWGSVVTPFSNVSNRTEVPLAFCDQAAQCDSPSGLGDHALISGHFKVVNGTQGSLGWWQGQLYPNASSKDPAQVAGCPSGCLFDVFADPNELKDVKSEHPEVFAQLMDRLHALGQTTYQTNYSAGFDVCEDVLQAKLEARGFLKPRCTKASTQEP